MNQTNKTDFINDLKWLMTSVQSNQRAFRHVVFSLYMISSEQRVKNVAPLPERRDSHCATLTTSAHKHTWLKQQIPVTECKFNSSQVKSHAKPRYKTKGFKLTPQMINNIEVADLGEEPANGFFVFLSVSDGPRPVQQTRHQRGVVITTEPNDDLAFAWHLVVWAMLGLTSGFPIRS